MRTSALAFNLLRYFVLVDAYDENPISQRYVIANGSICTAILPKVWCLSYSSTTSKICYWHFDKKVFKYESVVNSIKFFIFFHREFFWFIFLIKNGFLTQLFCFISSLAGKYFSNENSVSFKCCTTSLNISSIFPSTDSNYSTFNKVKLSISRRETYSAQNLIFFESSNFIIWLENCSNFTFYW